MKSIIFLIWAFASLTSNAQSKKPWVKLKIDSAEFVDTYGTESQYIYQSNLRSKSSHGYLNIWVGAKAIYLYYFALFLGETYNVTWSPGQKDLVIRATPKIYNNPKPPEIKLIASIDTATIVKTVSITGPADDIARIFINYWELTPITLNELKTKKSIVKEFGSDKVSIQWTSKYPVIIVVKNQNAVMDFFPFRKKS